MVVLGWSRMAALATRWVRSVRAVCGRATFAVPDVGPVANDDGGSPIGVSAAIANRHPAP